jgi:dipeptidase E
MANRRLLLLSNSKNSGQQYLAHAEREVTDFLGSGIKRVLFVPFAGVRISFDDYAAIVQMRFKKWGYALDSAHQPGDPVKAVREAEAIAVGGGNTFCLLSLLYDKGLIEAIRARVGEGVPYIGWSAGSNVACPTIKTSNDMAIVEPPSLTALGLVPFQINPHYTDYHPPGHEGETRAERLTEFVELNPGVYVVGLREGSMLQVEGDKIELLGDKEARVFIKGRTPADYQPGASLQFLLGEPRLS